MAAATDKASLLQCIAEAGIVGAGGAGFPTHVKLSNQVDTLILNAAECEPLLHKDKELLRRFPHDVLSGLQLGAELVGARDVAIGIKGKYHDVLEQLTPLLPGGMRIVPLSDSYPSGDEFILVYDVTKRVIPPGKLPLDVGCLSMNVETALNVGRAAGAARHEGPEARSHGGGNGDQGSGSGDRGHTAATERAAPASATTNDARFADNRTTPVTAKYLTVAGAVAQPSTLRVPIGVTFREVLELAGGATCADPHILAGGVMMGRLADLDAPITKTTGGAIVLPADHFLIRRYTQSWRQIATIGASACDQCSFCTEFCPRYLLGHPIEPHKAMRSLGFTETKMPQVLGTQFCCECNLCTMMACPEDLDPKNVCTTNKRQLLQAGRRWEVEAHPYRAELNLDNRRVPISRLINKLGLRQFENKGPLVEVDYQPSKVTLLLQQHVGAQAEPVVADGQRVACGDVVARPPAGKLGAVIHASISGTVKIGSEKLEVRS